MIDNEFLNTLERNEYGELYINFNDREVEINLNISGRGKKNVELLKKLENPCKEIEKMDEICRGYLKGVADDEFISNVILSNHEGGGDLPSNSKIYDFLEKIENGEVISDDEIVSALQLSCIELADKEDEIYPYSPGMIESDDVEDKLILITFVYDIDHFMRSYHFQLAVHFNISKEFIKITFDSMY